MKKVIIYLIAVIILVSTSGSLFAQVTFRMKRAPLNQLRSADLWNATIINTGETFTAYLYGSLTNNENSELIATGQTMTFEVKKGTTNFKVSDLPKIPDVSYLAKDPKYKQSFMNTGGAPPGDYKICCELRRTDNTVAGEDCFDQKIIGGDAPQLISPRDEEEIRIDNPVFTWMHIKAPGSNQTYTIKIVEIRGDQSPDEAMKRNTVFFEKEGISQTLFQYPASAPKFEAGKKYAWMVKVGDLQSNISIFDRWGIKTLPVKKSPLAPFCTDFEDGTPGGWQVNNALKTIKPTGGHPGQYIETTDQSGSSYFFNVDSTYTGNWGDLMTDSCGSLCFDVNYIYNGDDYYYTTDSFSSPPLTMQPYIAIEGSGFAATFVTWNIISVGDGWHTYCAPLKYLNSDGTLPSNSDGHWVMTPGSEVNWNSLLSNVTKVRLRVDVQNYQNERIGYDNICIKNTGDCVPPPDHGSICDSFKVVPVRSAIGDCCWSLNLTHPSNTANITKIQFLAQSPNTFVTGSCQLGSPSGWFFPVNTPQEFTIQKLAGSIPTGQQNGFFNFCMNKLSSPQHVVVNWIKNDNSIVCSDTITLNCDIPCVTFSKDTLLCNGNNYNLHYSFTNNSSFPINKIEVVNTVPSGISVSPSPLTLSTSVTPGQTTNQPAFTISGATPDSSVCIIFKFTSPDGCCWCYDTLCVKIPSCVCNEVSADITGDPLNCCYSLNLHNNYSGNYFTQINLTTLETGVAFSTWNTNISDNWYSTNTNPDNKINLINNPANYPNNFIPTGNLSNIANFCLTNYTSTTQHILVEWVGKDSVKCVDTLITRCIPPPPPTLCVQLINDSLICLPNGTFQYTFHIKNNSSHTTTGFQFNPLSPSSLIFSPANFSNVTIAPNMISPQQTLIISGVNPGSQFCFNISLYEHRLIDGQQYYDWCCYSTEICKTMPNCNIGQGCLETKLDSLWCIKDPTGVKKYGYIISLTNLTSTIGNYVLSNSCGTFLGNNSGSISANSTISVSGQFSTSQTGSCCIYTEMFLYTPVKTDTCYDTLCFRLPNCDSIIIYHDTCECGDKWSPHSNIGYINPDGKENQLKIGCFEKMIYGPMAVGSVINYNANSYVCNKPDCIANYKWNIIDLGSGSIVNSGTTTTLPVTFTAPPESKYRFTIYAYCGDKVCDSCGFNFSTIGKPDCDCGKWESNEIQVSVNDRLQHPVLCDAKFPVDLNSQLTLTFPAYICNTENCIAEYSWDLTGGSGVIPIHVTGTGNPFNYMFNTPGSYILSFKAYCGGRVCDSCWVRINVIQNDCGCGDRWSPHSNIGYKDPTGIENKMKIGCFEKMIYGPMAAGSNITYNASSYLCSKPGCITNYKWNIIDLGSGSIINSGTTTTLPVTFTAPPESKYRFTIYAYCGDRICDSCGFNFRTVGKPDCDCGGWSEDKKGFTIHGFNGNIIEEIETFLPCGNKHPGIIEGVSLDFVSQTYNCIGKENCKASYDWKITSPITGTQTSFNTQVINNFQLNELGTYSINLKVSCNGKVCDSCTSYIDVIKPPNPTGCDSSSNHRLYDAISFMNTLTSSQLIDFSTNDDGSPISSSGSPVPLSGWTRNGLTFSNCTSYWNQYIVSSAGQYITIVFPSGMYKKAGFDMGLYYPMVGNYTIKVTSGNCIYTYVQPGDANPYFGINLPTAIDKIEVTHNTGNLIVDNFRFGN